MPVNYSALVAVTQGQACLAGKRVSFDRGTGHEPLAGAAAQRALDLLGYELVLVDPSASVLDAGDITARRGSPIAVKEGRLVGSNELDTKRLHATIKAVVDQRGEAFHSVRMLGDVEVLIGRVPGASTALVLLGNRDVPAEKADALADLTDAETRLLKALVNGERLASYSERTGIKLTTAKTHLQALFGKSGQRRQADLIRWALSFRDLG